MDKDHSQDEENTTQEKNDEDTRPQEKIVTVVDVQINSYSDDLLEDSIEESDQERTR